MKISVSPSSVDADNATLSVVVEHAADSQTWYVRVVITRPPDQPRLTAEDVDAKLTAADGHSLPLVRRDRGALVEAGDSLGMSANADFRFASSGHPPSRLTVTCQGTTAEFLIDADHHPAHPG
jgi:hypothetical protein